MHCVLGLSWAVRRVCVVERAQHQRYEGLTGTRCPFAGVLDVYLSGGVDEAEEHTRADWDGVLFVVDVGQMQVGVHIVGECLVANTRETVTNGLEGCSHG